DLQPEPARVEDRVLERRHLDAELLRDRADLVRRDLRARRDLPEARQARVLDRVFVGGARGSGRDQQERRPRESPHGSLVRATYGAWHGTSGRLRHLWGGERTRTPTK